MARYLCFVLVILLAACAPSAVPGVVSTAIPTATLGAASTPAPTATATFSPLVISPVIVDDIPPPEPACDDTPEARLILQERGMVSADDARVLNVRVQPGTDNNILGTLKVYETFLVLEGPECNDGYAWYRIESNVMSGWIAEGDFNVYYVEPYLPG